MLANNLRREQFMLAPAFRDEREKELARIEHEKQEAGRKSLEEFFGKELLETSKTL